MMNNTRWLLPAVMACLVVATPLAAQDMHKQDLHKHGGHHPRFDDPKKWSASFDDPERDKWQMPDRIVAALALKPADTVADIGAGTGYMAVRFARQLKSGTVLAVDIEPNMVKHLTERARQRGSITCVQLPAARSHPICPKRSMWRFCSTSIITSISGRITSSGCARR